jgi:hypothetical protein
VRISWQVPSTELQRHVPFYHDAIDSDGVIATFSSPIFLMLSWMEESKEKITSLLPGFGMSGCVLAWGKFNSCQ